MATTHPQWAEIASLLNILSVNGFTVKTIDDGGEIISPANRAEAVESILSVVQSWVMVENGIKRDTIMIVLGNEPGIPCADWSETGSGLEDAIMTHNAQWEREY